MTEEMDHVFGGLAPARTETAADATWTPAIDVSDRDGNYVIRAEIAGVNPEDVMVEVTGQTVIIQGERKEEREENRSGVRLTERRYGRFFRSIPLPEEARTDDVRARFDNGVLEISVPLERQQQSNRRQVQIESGSRQQGGSSEPAA